MEVVRISVTERVPRVTWNEVGKAATLAAYLNDDYGDDDGGRNRLRQILMRVQDELRSEDKS